MGNNEHWNTVDWSQIPEDVEAVVMYPHTDPTYYKMGEGGLICQCYRVNGYFKSSWSNYDKILKEVDDRFHLRPTPSIQPTPEPPESTQVESSQGEVTNVPEFDWSTIEDDVEAVFIFENGTQKYKVIDSVLMYNRGDGYKRSSHESLGERVASAQKCCTTYYIRPPATPPTDKVITKGMEYDESTDTLHVTGKIDPKLDDQPITCKVEYYEGELPEGMIDLDKVGGEIQVEYVTLEKPSIQSILSDAQGLIKKHYNITGEVKFTIKCS